MAASLDEVFRLGGGLVATCSAWSTRITCYTRALEIQSPSNVLLKARLGVDLVSPGQKHFPKGAQDHPLEALVVHAKLKPHIVLKP